MWESNCFDLEDVKSGYYKRENKMAKTKKKNKKKKSDNKSDEEILLEIQKSPKAKVIVKINEYKGKNYLMIQELWRSDEDVEEDNDDWKFSKKVVSLSLDPAKEGKTSMAEKFVKKFMKAFKKREW